MNRRLAAVIAAAAHCLSGCAHAPAAPPAPVLWSGPDNGNTHSAENPCGAEFTLEVRGLPPDSVFDVHAVNPTDRALRIDPLQAKIEMDDRRLDIPPWAAPAGTYEIPAYGELEHAFPLPSGPGLERGPYLQITLPVQDMTGAQACELHTTLVPATGTPREARNPSPHVPRESASERTSWDLFAGLGLPVIRSSNLSALGGAGPALLAMGTYFITPSSGISLLAGVEGSSSKIGTAAQLAPAGTLQNLNATLLEALFALTYTYRTHIGQRWAASYSVGPGAYYFDLSGTDYDPVQCAYYGNCNTDSQDFGSAFRLMVFQQLAVDYRFRPSGPAAESETGAGLALYGAWLPGGAWGPLPVSGISVGLLAFLLTGF